MIYLDNSATTPLSPFVKESMVSAMDTFGNPSSLHALGLSAEKLVTASRDAIFSALNIRNKDAYRLFFTSSGSEANNQVLLGAARAKNFRFTPRIVTTDSEHPSVLEPLALLKNSGVEIVHLSTKGGKISLDEVREAVNERTILISVMAVNNETGAIYDLKSIFSLAKRLNPSIITHSHTDSSGVARIGAAVLVLKSLLEGINLLDFVLSHHFNGGNFVGSTETIEEVEDRETAFETGV